MNQEWSLDVFYKGYEDSAFLNDLEQCKVEAKRLEVVYNKAKEEDTLTGLENIIKEKEKFFIIMHKVGEYLSLRQTTNTTDSKTNDYMSQFHTITASVSGLFAAIDQHIAQIPQQELEECLAKSELLAEYKYLLNNTREAAKYQFSTEMESMIAKMNLSGGNAWSRLFDYLTSTVKVPYEGEILTLSAVRNLASDSSKEVRKKAYEAELAAYDQIDGSIAFALNAIKSQVNMLSSERGYESALDMTLKQSHMKRETLDAMLTAMREYLPIFHKYLRAKAKYLGYKGGLPWYEMFAPLGKSEKKYTLEETKAFLIDSFGAFSQDMAELIERAFDEEWIDFFPRQGKVGGAFCAEASHVKQSRILTNFNGTFDAVDTLAHELGHAYHSEQIFSQRVLNREISMQVAETASTFNETHIMANAIKTAVGDEKLALLDSLLGNTTQTICDILSRFIFEDTVFDKCKDQFLMPNDLKDIMLSAQKESYGEGLDHEFLHPYMWTCKVHYYSEELSYYNFPYAFGCLFAMGLYTQFEKEGSTFVDKYRNMLHATPVGTVEETAQMMGIDITKPDFWRESLASFEKYVALFVTFM